MHRTIMTLQMLTPLKRSTAILRGTSVDLLDLARGGEELALELLGGESATTANDRGRGEGDGRLGDEGGLREEDGRLTGG